MSQAVAGALGGVGLTAFDKLPSELRQLAIDRYHARVAERDRDMGGHGQHSDPVVRAELGEQ